MFSHFNGLNEKRRQFDDDLIKSTVNKVNKVT